MILTNFLKKYKNYLIFYLKLVIITHTFYKEEYMLYLEPLNDFTNDIIIKLLHDYGVMEEAIIPSIKDEKGKNHRVLKISEENFILIEKYKKDSTLSNNFCFNIFKLVKGSLKKISK